jgi:hypothetical protein
VRNRELLNKKRLSFRSRSVFLIRVVCFLVCGASVHALGDPDPIFAVNPETANLIVDRTDYSVNSVPVITRKFRRLEKERGIFGPGWCSNLDLSLVGADAQNPKQIELHDCQRSPRAHSISISSVNRVYRRVLDAWVEESSASRILRKHDGRWELIEAPFSTF